MTNAPGWRMETVSGAPALHRYWGLVRAGLERVRVRGRQNWWVEDIYGAIVAGRALLQVGFIDGRYVAAVITSIETDPYSGEHLLLIWAVYSQERAAMELGLREVEQRARAAGLSRLRFISPRRGMMRRAGALGFTAQQQIYDKVI